MFRYLRYLVVACWAIGQSVSAELILATPPILTEERSKEIFEPFAEALSDIIGDEVTYSYPRDWLVYAKEMRLGNYDLIFDQAHFVSWRLQPGNIFHSAVVSLPGYEQYVVVAKDDSGYYGIEDLLSAKVCSLPSPGLSTIVFLAEFSNPVRQPVMVEAQGGFDQVFSKFEKNDCSAAVLSKTHYDNLVETGKASTTKLLFTSQPIPNLTMTITKKHPKDIADKLVSALTDELSPKGADKIFQHFAVQDKKFEVANVEDLNQLKNLLRGVVWGW